MEQKENRTSLIMKLTKANLEVHNVDQPMYKIEQFFKEHNTNTGSIETPVVFHEICDEKLKPTVTINQDSLISTRDEERFIIELPPMDAETNNIAQETVCKEHEAPTDESVSKLLGLDVSNVSQNEDKQQETGCSRSKVTETEYSEKNATLEIPVANEADSDVNENDTQNKISSSSSSCSTSSSSSSSTSSEPFGSGYSDLDSDYHPSDSEQPPKVNKKLLFQSPKKAIAKRNLDEKEIEPPKKRGRKRKSNEKNWQRNITKRLRDSGKSYTSNKITKQIDGTKIKSKVTRNERKILPPCTDKCRLKCKDKITEETRQTIFQEYWDLASLQRQRDFIASAMTQIGKSKCNERKRNLNNAFYFQINGNKYQVCKQFFISTLGITTRTIRTVAEKQREKAIHGIIEGDARGKHKNHKRRGNDIEQGIRDHINSIPRVKSHYCRARTQKEYIEGTRTIADLHRDYVEVCKNRKMDYCTYRTYYNVFTTEFNIAFYFPRKDQCDLCVEFKNASEGGKEAVRERYENHLLEKDLARIERETDKKSDKYIITYDLQATMPCPIGSASSFYYISKLNMFNLTFANALDEDDVSCYVWHEGEGKRGANEISTCVWHFLNKVNLKAAQEGKMIDIVFYTDNCSGQNKNRFLFALYSHTVGTLSNINVITHKYLIKGHTQNDADNIHSVIGKQIIRYKKAAPIYDPDQYISIIRQARKSGKPYTVHELSHGDFLDFKDLAVNMGVKESFKVEGKNINISEIKVLECRKDSPSRFLCKLSYGEDDFMSIDYMRAMTRSAAGKSNREIKIKSLYDKKLAISESKKKRNIIINRKKHCTKLLSQLLFKPLIHLHHKTLGC